jgi:predicted lipoprotein with Yx(FWY)xxD motif
MQALLARVLVDSSGPTLYLFEADSATMSACAIAWSPLAAHGKPTISDGANASLVGISRRSDGTQQLTYDGHAHYVFVKHHKPGDLTGQGVTAFGAPWYVLSAAGNQISSRPTTTTGGVSSGGGYGL